MWGLDGVGDAPLVVGFYLKRVRAHFMIPAFLLSPFTFVSVKKQSWVNYPAKVGILFYKSRCCKSSKETQEFEVLWGFCIVAAVYV